MNDISNQLNDIISAKNCSSVLALFILSGEQNGIQVLQSEPRQNKSGGLCYQGYKQTNGTRLGNDIY